MTYDGMDVYSVVDQYLGIFQVMKRHVKDRPTFHPAYDHVIKALDETKEKLEKMYLDRRNTLMDRAFEEAKERPDYKGQSVTAVTHDNGNTWVGEFVLPPEDEA